MKQVTYDLRHGSSGARDFYWNLGGFADRTLELVEAQAGDLLSAYAAFVAARGEDVRSRGEYAVELLTLGVTWQRYGAAARHCPAMAARACVALFRLRRAFPRAKPLLDPVRGWLASRLLLGGEASGTALACDTGSLARLIRWLEATGEFKDEVKRLRHWHALGVSRGPEFYAKLWETALRCTVWFRDAAARELGPYTAGVERFLRERHPAYDSREDRIFCGKAEVEYHLCMLSSELTNRGLREAFARTPCKVVLLPACMRPSNGEGCRARQVAGELCCSACSEACAIGRVTRLGLARGFETRIIPHSSGFTRSLLRFRDQEQEGVVAVACALNIVPGGYEMRELRIPSQCVLLDYSGCRRHWHPTGVPTDLDDRRLLEVVAAPADPASRVSRHSQIEWGTSKPLIADRPILFVTGIDTAACRT